MAKLFYPYEFDSELKLQVTGFTDEITGDELHFPASNIGDGAVRHAFNLASSGWTRMEVSLVLSSDIRGFGRLLQPGEDSNQSLRPLLSVRCPATKLRFVSPVVRNGSGWRGVVVLDRRLVRRVVTIRPLLIRTAPGITNYNPTRANTMGALLGEGPAIQLQIDVGQNPFEGGLDVRWEDFRASQNTWRRTHDRDLYSLSFDPEPVLWLNERHQELQAVLHDEYSAGFSSLVRNTLLAYVKEGVWSSLFRAAVAVVERDPETGEVTAPTGWQETVLTILLPHIYPQESSDAERLERLAIALEETDAGADVEVRLRSAVQVLSKSSESVKRLLRKVGE